MHRKGSPVERNLSGSLLFVGGLLGFAEMLESVTSHLSDGAKVLLTLGFDGFCERLTENIVSTTDKFL